MARFCASCGAAMPDISGFCPACGKAVSTGNGGAAAAVKPAPAPQPAPKDLRAALPDNVAGMLAYLLVPAVMFLLLEPYRRNRFVRFHSFQALFCAAATMLSAVALMSLGMSATLALLVLLLGAILFFGVVILAAVLFIKAFQGEMFKLPLIGEMAERRAHVA